MLNNKTMVLAAIGFFWLVQPFLLLHCFVRQPRWKQWNGLALFILGNAWLSRKLLHVREPNTDICVIWGPCCVLLCRYLHAIGAGGHQFAKEYGLTPRHTTLVNATLLTVPMGPIFHIKDTPVVGDNGNAGRIIWRRLLSGAFSMTTMYSIFYVVITCRIDEYIPTWMERTLYMICLCFCEDGGTIFFEIPYRICMALLGINNVIVSPNLYLPILSTSPRNFWRRWSLVNAFSLQKGIYLPLRRRGYSRPLATLMTFATNSAVHMLTLGYFLQGIWHAKAWFYILIVFPMTSLWLQDRFATAKQSWVLSIINYLLLILPMLQLQPLLAQVILLPPDLHGFAIHMFQSIGITGFN